MLKALVAKLLLRTGNYSDTSGRHYQAVFQSAADFAIVTMDRGGRVTDWSPGAERILGWTAAEMRGQSVECLFTPEDRAEGCPHAEMRRALETGRASDERWHLRKDGSRFWASGEMHPLRDEAGRHIGFLKILRDRTEQRQFGVALRKSEASYRATFDQAAVGVAQVALDGTWLRVNARLCEMLGYTQAELLETTFQDITHPDDLEPDLANIRRLLDGEIETYSIEKRYIRKDGAVLWVNLTVSLLRDESGAPQHFISIIEDISARKRAEEELRKSQAELRQFNEHLEARVREEVAAREEAQARLAHARRMEALGQLAGGIAHDFNNVLQAVKSSGTLIERNPIDPEAVRRLARVIVEAATRGSAITQRLLAFSRRGHLQAEPLDAAELFASVREILAYTIGAGIEIRVAVATDLPPLLADRGQLETVLINLATNARDAMAGTGTLTLSAVTDTLLRDDGSGHPVTLKAGSYVRLSVSDTGCGMDPVTLARASEPFFTTKPLGEGTGLGLAMARGFAEQSGGGLFIESEPGHGTTVTMWFPVADPATVPPSTRPEEPKPEPTTSGRRPSRILVVDDQDLVRDVLAAQLADLGYNVVQAEGGVAALALLDTDAAIDLLVSDLSMPGMDGITLIREAQRRRPRLPAILMTGYVDDAAKLAVNGELAGAVRLLRKPVDDTRLADCVATMLEASGAP